MNALVHLLAQNPLLLLFAVVGLGYLLGNVRVAGFSLGVSAVLFVGLAAGALDPALALPDYVYVIGLVLFVYAVGLQSGPGFFASFGRRGLRANLVAALLLALGAGVAVGIARLARLPGPEVAGLFCGALTTTPGLAAAVESLKQVAIGMPPAVAARLADRPVVAYGLAYPFGVLGVILAFEIFTRLFRIDFEREEAERRKGEGSDLILRRTYRVTNPAAGGRPVDQALSQLGDPGFVVSRVRRGGREEVARPDLELASGDLVVAVGTDEALQRALILFGEECPEAADPPQQPGGISNRRVFVSNPAVVGRTLAQSGLQRRFNATITRLGRGEVDFVPAADTVLELGDRVRVVAPDEEMEAVVQYLGDSLRAQSETDFLSISLGIVLGVLVGMIPFPLPNGATFKLGFAGGPLIVALILGRLERTGPIRWGLPLSASLVLRQLGLVFFLAAIGTRAGHGFGDIFAQGGWVVIGSGALLTALVASAGVLAGYRYLKLPMSMVTGMVAGMHTQPACLAFASQQARNDLPSVGYATVYPVSMITKILLAQALVALLVKSG